MTDDMSTDKKESEGSGDSMDSPKAEALEPLQDLVVAQKRKGGRKPIYATSEERKQRNRQAQAAFRVRRTEYINQLEETTRVHEVNLHDLQTAYRSATDECLMLRYKNSLLERILLEKGIDVQAELQRKTGPRVDMAHVPASQTPTSSAVVKIDPESPQSRPTSSPHTSLATPSTVGFNDPMVAPPTASEVPGSPILCTAIAVEESSLQSHFDQLEQEYNAQADMVDDEDISSGPGPYPGPLSTTRLQQQTPNQQQLFTPQSQDWQVCGNSLGSSMSLPLEPYNPMLDPFGLSASMQFPISFSFDASSMR